MKTVSVSARAPVPARELASTAATQPPAAAKATKTGQRTQGGSRSVVSHSHQESISGSVRQTAAAR